MPAESIIEISGLSKVYKDLMKPAVDIDQLSIARGEVFGLLGPNGAGKTSTISMLCGLLQPSTGSIKIAGMDSAKEGHAIKNIIGIVPQDIALYPSLTAKENLRFFGSMLGLKGKELELRIDEFLDQFGLTHSRDRKLETFSGGMKRRVNIIAAIMHKPKILFLDEPTVGIDVQSRNVIIDYLTKLNKNGMTIIYTSHHMEEAEKFCSYVAIIDQGKIIAAGTPAALIKREPSFRNLEGMFLQLTGKDLRD